MSTIAADPLALMPRGEAAAGSVTAPVMAGDGADFALALADVLAAGATPAVPDEAFVAGPVEGVVIPAVSVPAEAGDGTVLPLKLLEGLGRIVLPALAEGEGIADAVPMPDAATATADVAAGPAVAAGVAVPLQAQPVAAPSAVPAVEAGLVEAEAVAPVIPETSEGEAPALPPTVAAKAVAEGDETPADDGAAVPTVEAEMPVAEVAEAVTVAVAAVIAAPVAAVSKTGTEAPKQDAAAEVVRLAGAAPLMAQPAKGKKAETVAPQKGQPDAPADEAGEVEDLKSAKQDKDSTTEAKVAPRLAQVVPDAAARTQPDKRAEPAVIVVDAVRGAETASGAAPQMQATTPVTPQPVTSAPMAMDRPGWEVALTERIAAELSEDGQQIELDLSPERLGGLKITLEISDGQAQVRFVTETPEAARLIQQNEHRLSESLSRAGLSLGGHESASRDAQQQQGDRSGRGGPRGADIAFQRPAEPRPGMISGRAGSGLVNLIA